MPDDFLDALAAAPLADPQKPFLHGGRRKPGKKRNAVELADFRAERSAKKARLAREAHEHTEQLLAYYATTQIDPGKVARHIGITEDEARAGLARHGRAL